MTAEEKLKELYKAFWPFTSNEEEILLNEGRPMDKDDIDLISSSREVK